MSAGPAVEPGRILIGALISTCRSVTSLKAQRPGTLP